MNNLVATVIDTTGIQKYIFGSNRLRENIGGSYLVQVATDEWVKECLKKIGKVYEEIDDFEPHIITDNEIVAELVYAGGGNTVLLFKTEEYAKKFTRILSNKILREAPGLNIVIAHQEFDWDKKDSLRETIEGKLIKTKLESQKQRPRPSMPLLAMSVTANCNSTGFVAVDTSKNYGVPENDSYLVSREIVAKLKTVYPNGREPANKNSEPENREAANTKLINTIFKGLKLGKYQIPYDVDDLGRSEGESSYIAIVHADGNRLGNRFQEYAKTTSSNRDFVIAMRKLSKAINEAGKNALRAVAEMLIKQSIIMEDNRPAIQYVSTSGEVINQVNLQQRNGKTYLPFRPIVYGGDDITFVCDGRLGLSLAVKFLEKFEEFTANLPDNKGKATACAGIAIVKTHFPFAKAYALSESLCAEAKRWMRKETDDYKKPLFSALDWHIAASGLIGSINEIRQREYKVQIPERDEVASLLMRPMRSHSQKNEWRTWSGFAEVVHELNTHKDWKDRRNKVMALRDVLRQGREATKQFRQLYSLESLPAFPEANSKLAEEGWWNEFCGYFDAIETMEFYIPLGESSDE
ncbi:MAG: hypothetical protein KME64_02935 [Scytonematopsis contorta HA4267-MV1]|jgi:hypothetical protein|nr:hypothetical protein [Scytonematopsis contorta HA4267-MV1]